MTWTLSFPTLFDGVEQDMPRSRGSYSQFDLCRNELMMDLQAQGRIRSNKRQDFNTYNAKAGDPWPPPLGQAMVST